MARGYPDFEGNKSALYLKPEWEAFEAEDKDFRSFANNQAWIVGKARIDYTVPAGKTLYITQAGGVSYATLQENADNNQQCYFALRDFTDAEFKVETGGNGGVDATLNKPTVFPAGHRMFVDLVNAANHNCTLGVYAQGYEI